MVEYPISCEIRKWSVYVHINKINGKKYVGLTSKKPSHRWGKDGKNYKNTKHFFAAINKYGWDNFIHIVLEQNLTKTEASNLEIILIAVWKTTNQNYGYNFQIGGYYGNLGLKMDEDVCAKRSGRNNPISKSVVCLNDRTIYESAREAALDKKISGGGEILLSINGRMQYSGKDSNGNPLIWVLYDDYLGMSDDDIYNKLNTEIKTTNSRKIVCLNTGQVFNSSREAGRIYNCDHAGIIKVCASYSDNIIDHKRRYCGRDPETNEWLSWMYYDDYILLSDAEKTALIPEKRTGENRFYKPIICLNTLEYFERTNIITDVSTSKSAGNIQAAISNYHNTCGKHLETNEPLHWMNFDKYINLSQDEKDYLKDQYYTGSFLMPIEGRNVYGQQPSYGLYQNQSE